MKRLLMIVLGLLMASGAFGQKRWTLSVEESLGVGFGGTEPRVVSTTEFVATRSLGSLFSVGAGIGLRVADAVTDYIVKNGGLPPACCPSLSLSVKAVFPILATPVFSLSRMLAASWESTALSA